MERALTGTRDGRARGVLLSIASYCTRCGFSNIQGHTYCPNCGNNLTMAAAAAGAPPAAAPPPVGPYGAPPAGYPPAGYPPAGYPPAYYAPPPVRRATAGAIIGDTFNVFGKDLFVYVAVFLLYAAITVGITLALTFFVFGTPQASVTFNQALINRLGANALTAFIVLDIVAAVVGAIVEAIVWGLVIYYAVQRYRGVPTTLRQALDQAVRRFLSILGAGLVIALIVGGLIVVPVGLMVAGAFMLDFALMGGGFLLFIVFGILVLFLILAWSVYAPTIMMEGQTALGSLSRSWELTKGHRLSILGAGIAIGLLAAIVNIAISLVFGIAGDPYITAVGSVLGSAITGSWILIMCAVAYQLIISEPRYGVWPPPYAAPSPFPPAPPARPGPPMPPSGPS